MPRTHGARWVADLHRPATSPVCTVPTLVPAAPVCSEPLPARHLPRPVLARPRIARAAGQRVQVFPARLRALKYVRPAADTRTIARAQRVRATSRSDVAPANTSAQVGIHGPPAHAIRAADEDAGGWGRERRWW
ncbi:uncharacterized protein SCHCODRAFT_02094034 [Schizophyllum commune H4-8]|uniref:uncharacterized protein n=1 Tax=Schizophyllum commune (strain H4-8 / FGSC 9210) TaxID=578458 RepID=UPI00215F8210|nr:uncharacterized protein SCHCODRAFT_02094034 [Schizophyllum commune H4-8]KAI5886258.1 hypothetical protein SCHCODRAFT_02094034 [Schizophyllum commune H4-8]